MGAGLIGEAAVTFLLSTIESLLPISVLIRSDSASISVGTAASVTASTGDLQMLSDAQSSAIGSPSSKWFTFGYGRATSTATVDVSGSLGATLGSVDVLADGGAWAEMDTTTQRYFDQRPSDPTQTAASVAVTDAIDTATATLEHGASISAANQVQFSSTGTLNSKAEPSAGNYADGTAAIALGLEFSTANITTSVDGTITTTGSRRHRAGHHDRRGPHDRRQGDLVRRPPGPQLLGEPPHLVGMPPQGQGEDLGGGLARSPPPSPMRSSTRLDWVFLASSPPSDAKKPPLGGCREPRVLAGRSQRRGHVRHGREPEARRPR